MFPYCYIYFDCKNKKSYPITECGDGRTCTLVENCPYASELNVKIDGSSDFREMIQLQSEYFNFIKSLLCGKGPDPMICCDLGKKYATINMIKTMMGEKINLF